MQAYEFMRAKEECGLGLHQIVEIWRYGRKVLAAMRRQFGGQAVKKAGK